MKTLLILFFVAIPLLSFSQQINIEVCNDASSIAARNSCIKGYVESLVHDQLQKIANQEDQQHALNGSLYLDAIGNFYIRESLGTLENASEFLEQILQKIKPPQVYRNKDGAMLEDDISFEVTVFPITNPLSTLEIPTEKNIPEKKQEDNKKEKEDVPFAVIENVPIFPGCYQDTNAELRNCMSKKITEHVVNNFDQNMMASLGLPPGKQRINVQFKINTEGFVVGVRARAAHLQLEAEAIRVVQSIPRMIPGRQRGENVGVLYALPIVFQVDGLTVDKKERKRNKRG